MNRVNISRRTTANLLAQVLRLENLDFMAQFVAWHQPPRPVRVSKFWHYLVKLWFTVIAVIVVIILSGWVIIY